MRQPEGLTRKKKGAHLSAVGGGRGGWLSFLARRPPSFPRFWTLEWGGRRGNALVGLNRHGLLSSPSPSSSPPPAWFVACAAAAAAAGPHRPHAHRHQLKAICAQRHLFFSPLPRSGGVRTRSGGGLTVVHHLGFEQCSRFRLDDACMHQRV
jgi:hypothetical protein